MSLVNLEISAAGLDQVITDLQATQRQADKALKSTQAKVAAWLRTKSLRGLSKELQVPMKEMRRRLKGFSVRVGTGSKVTIWYGLDPMGLIHVGKARETATGVKAGKHSRAGAFIAKGKNGSKQVFKRKGSGRLPLQKQNLEISDKASTYIEDRLIGTAEFDSRFLSTFEHELQWQMRTQK